MNVALALQEGEKPDFLGNPKLTIAQMRDVIDDVAIDGTCGRDSERFAMRPVHLTLERYRQLVSVTLFLDSLVPVQREVAALLKQKGGRS